MNERPSPFEPPPDQVQLLRAIWARRGELGAGTAQMVHNFLQRVQHAALTPRQLESAVALGRRLGIGHDAPEEPGDRPRVPAPQPWGPLPLRPPGR